MKNENEPIYVAFFDRAKPIFYRALKEFQTSIKRLNRNTEEYKFNELKQQHIKSLKQKLEEVARSVIEEHQHNKQLRELDQGIQQTIKGYLHEFVLRSGMDEPL